MNEATAGGTERPAFVLLEDGTWYAGTLVGAGAPAFGEVVFTTNMTGYQETFTDPSYLGQIVVMTAPMIGNYGVTAEDAESALARTVDWWRAWSGRCTYDGPYSEAVLTSLIALKAMTTETPTR